MCALYLDFRTGVVKIRCIYTVHHIQGSIPDGVIEFFIDIILPAELWL
jgi:hypothetical protein